MGHVEFEITASERIGVENLRKKQNLVPSCRVMNYLIWREGFESFVRKYGTAEENERVCKEEEIDIG